MKRTRIGLCALLTGVILTGLAATPGAASARPQADELVDLVAKAVADATGIPIDKAVGPAGDLVHKMTTHHDVTTFTRLENGYEAAVMAPHLHGSRLFDNLEKAAFSGSRRWMRITVIPIRGDVPDSAAELVRKGVRWVPKSDVPRGGDGWRRYPSSKDKQPVPLGKWAELDAASGKDYAYYAAARFDNLSKEAAGRLLEPNFLFLVELYPKGKTPPKAGRV